MPPFSLLSACLYRQGAKDAKVAKEKKRAPF